MYAHCVKRWHNGGKKQRVQHVCVCEYESECVRVLLLSPYFRYTNMAYQLSQKRARSKLRYTNTLTHTQRQRTPFTPTLPF